MSYTQRELDAADRHIHLAEQNIEMQKAVIQVLREQHLPVDPAYVLLEQLEGELRELCQRRKRMQAGLGAAA